MHFALAFAYFLHSCIIFRSFWTHWSCGGCVDMLRIERKLVDTWENSAIKQRNRDQGADRARQVDLDEIDQKIKTLGSFQGRGKSRSTKVIDREYGRGLSHAEREPDRVHDSIIQGSTRRSIEALDPSDESTQRSSKRRRSSREIE